ncbi:hypothetical protein [Desulfosarcina variabilis]|uniref:hypothetical protein n=1 Tax=Desulfosarcina variabilis TaxID=2300 RepID=UPI003AFA9170
MLQTYLKRLLTAMFWGGTFISGRMLAGSVTPFSAAFFRNFVPISAILLAHVILGESLTPALLVGAMMVIAGVSLNQLTVAGGRIIHSD